MRVLQNKVLAIKKVYIIYLRILFFFFSNSRLIVFDHSQGQCDFRIFLVLLKAILSSTSTDSISSWPYFSFDSCIFLCWLYPFWKLFPSPHLYGTKAVTGVDCQGALFPYFSTAYKEKEFSHIQQASSFSTQFRHSIASI